MTGRAGLLALVPLLVLGCGARSPSGGPGPGEAGRGSLLEIEGEVRLTVREDPTPRGRPPVPKLALETVREFGCQPHRIETEVSRAADTLRVELLGIAPPRGPCAPAFGPARGTVELDLPSGDRPLAVVRDGDEDRYELVLTDSTLRLRPVRAAFTSADTRLFLRYPPRSFALYCSVRGPTAPLCGRLRSWIAGREGITEHAFPADGVVPYRRGTGTDGGARIHYRWERPDALGPVRACFDRLDAVFAGLEGTRMTVELWTGELVRASGARRGPDGDPGPARDVADPGPDAAGGAPPCLPSVPPPEADSASVGRAERNAYYVRAARRLPCEVRRLQARADSARAASMRRLESGEDSTIHVPGAVSAPSPGGGEGEGGSAPDVIAPNSSRSADAREELHRELRSWLCAGGKSMPDSATLGDADRHPGSAWYWVVDGGDWHYLRPGTTAGAVEAYLGLVDEHGEELAWAAAGTPDGGPRRVAVGPDRAVLPGFLLYRWWP